MRARAYITPKGAETEADCQDRFSINAATGSVAVSDGMSQSLFPKYWAEILAERYTSDGDWRPTHDSVSELAPLWRERVNARLEQMREAGANTWRTENMLSDGISAGATLIGLRCSGEGWRCDALGDSCLIVVDDGAITDICSSMDTARFGNRPDFFDSDATRRGKGEVATFEGEWLPGRVLLLVSDPMAAYLASLRGSVIEAARLKELLGVSSADEFSILVEYWRKDGMHDDDTTVVIVTNEDHGLDCGFNRQTEWVW